MTLNPLPIVGKTYTGTVSSMSKYGFMVALDGPSDDFCGTTDTVHVRGKSKIGRKVSVVIVAHEPACVLAKIMREAVVTERGNGFPGLFVGRTANLLLDVDVDGVFRGERRRNALSLAHLDVGEDVDAHRGIEGGDVRQVVDQPEAALRGHGEAERGGIGGQVEPQWAQRKVWAICSTRK